MGRSAALGLYGVGTVLRELKEGDRLGMGRWDPAGRLVKHLVENISQATRPRGCALRSGCVGRGWFAAVVAW